MARHRNVGTIYVDKSVESRKTVPAWPRQERWIDSDGSAPVGRPLLIRTVVPEDGPVHLPDGLGHEVAGLRGAEQRDPVRVIHDKESALREECDLLRRVGIAGHVTVDVGFLAHGVLINVHQDFQRVPCLEELCDPDSIAHTRIMQNI